MPDTLRSLKELECLGNGKAPDQGYKVGERTRWRDRIEGVRDTRPHVPQPFSNVPALGHDARCVRA